MLSMGFTLCSSVSIFDPSFIHLPSVGLHHLARERVLVGTLGVLSSRKGKTCQSDRSHSKSIVDAAYPVDNSLNGRVDAQGRERYAQDDLFDTMEVPVSQMLFPLYIAIEPDNGRLTEMAEQKKKNVDKRLPK
jgi:hypothetical protein